MPADRSAAQPARRPADAPTTSPAARPLRILVADDNDDGREMLGYLLTAEGHTVAQAATVRRRRAAGAFQPDVAILDIGMPGMSGYAVARRCASSPRGAALVLVALSGLGQQEDKARAAEAGFDRHFTKPVDINELRVYLATVGRTHTVS